MLVALPDQLSRARPWHIAGCTGYNTACECLPTACGALALPHAGSHTYPFPTTALECYMRRGHLLWRAKFFWSKLSRHTPSPWGRCCTYITMQDAKTKSKGALVPSMADKI